MKRIEADSKIPEEWRMVFSDADSLGKAGKEFSEKPFLGASLGTSSAPYIRAKSRYESVGLSARSHHFEFSTFEGRIEATTILR